jgi:NADPH:quinone reductase-like Zn-dependent oxidoreductase
MLHAGASCSAAFRYLNTSCHTDSMCLQALEPRMPLAGKRVLVHAGAGGVGGFAVQVRVAGRGEGGCDALYSRCM